ERAFITNPIVGSGAYIVDRDDFRRGPFSVSAPHGVDQTNYISTSLMCATCHEIDNPLLSFDNTTQEFKLNTLDAKAPAGDKLFPVERTYAEWEFSQFNKGGVTGLDSIYTGIKRVGNSVDGPITVCQDCHMPMETSALVIGGANIRTVGVHDFSGGS